MGVLQLRLRLLHQTQAGLLMKDMVLLKDLPVILMLATLHLMLEELLMMVMVHQKKALEMKTLMPLLKLLLEMLKVNILPLMPLLKQLPEMLTLDTQLLLELVLKVTIPHLMLTQPEQLTKSTVHLVNIPEVRMAFPLKLWKVNLGKALQQEHLDLSPMHLDSVPVDP